MIILAIETSCDETAVAVVQNGRDVLGEQLISQTEIHTLYGGIVPELASRNHAAHIGRLAELTLRESGVTLSDINAVAVTFAPGLIGALLVGVNFAKGVALGLDVPLIPVHHIRGHIASNYIAYPELKPPFLCVIVSGGNSIIADVSDYTVMRIIGQTRDDSAGECFDKAARAMGFGYPGGPEIDRLSKGGDDTMYKLPRPVINECPYDMSFSGLKTAVVNLLHNAEQKGEAVDKASIAASLSAAISDILVSRITAAAKECGRDKIVVAGGVAANSRIRADLITSTAKIGKELYLAPLRLCGDNAAMIGAQGYYEYLSGVRANMDLNAYATMSVDNVWF